MVAILLGADNGFFYAGQVMHFSSPFTVFLIYHKQPCRFLIPNSLCLQLLTQADCICKHIALRLSVVYNYGKFDHIGLL